MAEEKAKESRKGQFHPTSDEKDEMEDLAYELLSLGLPKSEIKKAFREKYDVTPRTIETYLSRARARVLIIVQKAKEEFRAESVAFYDAMTRVPGANARERILARERIDKLMGLDAPQKVAPVTPDGDSEYSGLSEAELNARIIAALTERDAASVAQEARAGWRQERGLAVDGEAEVQD